MKYNGIELHEVDSESHPIRLVFQGTNYDIDMTPQQFMLFCEMIEDFQTVRRLREKWKGPF